MTDETLIKNVDTIIGDIKRILPELTFPEIQGFGFALKEVTKINVDFDENEGMFTSQNILNSLEKLAEKARKGDDDTSYMQILFAYHALGTVHVYNDFLMFSASMMSESDETCEDGNDDDCCGVCDLCEGVEGCDACFEKVSEDEILEMQEALNDADKEKASEK